MEDPVVEDHIKFEAEEAHQMTDHVWYVSITLNKQIMLIYEYMSKLCCKLGAVLVI